MFVIIYPWFPYLNLDLQKYLLHFALYYFTLVKLIITFLKFILIFIKFLYANYCLFIRIFYLIFILYHYHFIKF